MSDVVVKLRDHGPILISGEFVIEDGEGQPIDLAGKTNIALCRCSASKNSPFCDGSHKECGFVAENRAK
ncbi:CDGSH iron-sulfur domain-containing protein [uncultured Rubinisphaera sp.]|uniref:CDGSH iron-sulfur domain-containing protein n=1 Tax=uncultured Rubinisphaera sp. TaxID=1678686 RepID=UPI0030DC692A|tara:strand:+ start:830 stop:1036 length:207 start_codon:yes stop_codon:yes gene_type:complete